MEAAPPEEHLVQVENWYRGLLEVKHLYPPFLAATARNGGLCRMQFHHDVENVALYGGTRGLLTDASA
ncbi:MAG TPA: hypothetical protein VG759_25715 [Candidatus Angelobacter sp.]|nr:hypothetical protein [Candidatus Angelobacter sp.]